MTDTASAARAGSIGIGQVYRRSFALYQEREAIVGDDGERLTYGAIDAAAGRIAAWLTDLGLSRGDSVAVLSGPSAGYALVNVVGARIGIPVVGLNTRYTLDEICYCLDDSRARVVFVAEDQRHAIDDVAARDHVVRVVSLSLRSAGTAGLPTLRDVIEQAGARHGPELGQPGDIHTVLYTSGTTGRPKGAMISQSAAAIRALRLTSWFGLGEDDAYLGWSPLFHTGGDEPLNTALASGGRFLAINRADPDLLVRTVATERATWAWLLPGMFREFLEVAARQPGSLRTLRFGGGYGNLLPTSLIDELVTIGPAFYDLFGQTEVSLLIGSNKIVKPGETEWRKQPTPLLDIRIVSDDGRELGVGEPGECVVRGPSVMSGYLNREEDTAAAFDGGWLHTGDVLEWNDDGTMRFADRKKYLIKSGGENVYPAEVEAVLSAHPDVVEVCVVGVPDERWGETVKAFIVLRSGSRLSPADLTTYCRPRLAGYKRPRAFAFLSPGQVPRSATGKIVRAELAKLTLPATEAGQS